MFMTKMVSLLPQLAACGLQPAVCRLPPATCHLPPVMQIEKMPQSRCKWSCRCVSRVASAFACLPALCPLLPLPPLSPLYRLCVSLCPLALQFRALWQAASHQLNIVMRFTPTPHTPPPPPHTLSLTRCQYTIRISVGISPLVKFVVQVT